MNESPRNSLRKGGKSRTSVADPATIPDKLYFKIGEVSEIAGVEPHVLRFWESEFKIIRPQRAASKQRLYRRVDVENFLAIKKLLYVDGFTVPGARKFLAAREKGGPTPALGGGSDDKKLFSEVKSELLALKKMLDDRE